MLTRNQKIASDVFKRIKNLETDPKKKQYGSMAHKLPVLIQKAGLVQALSFVDAKSKKEQILRTLLTDLANTLEFTNSDALIKESREAKLTQYLHLTQKSMAALLWYKRFAQSVLGVEAGEFEDQL